MDEEFKFYCLCGCKAYGEPIILPEEFIRTKIRDVAQTFNDFEVERIDAYNPDDEFYHIEKPTELWICSGTQPFLKDLTFPKDHYTFDVDKPCDLNALKIYNRYGDLILTPFILQGECKCKNTGLPVKQTNK